MKKKSIDVKKTVITLLIFALLIVGILIAAKVYDAKSEAQADEDTYDYLGNGETLITLFDQDYIYDHKIENFLIMGTDGSGNEEAIGEDYIGSMADFLAVAIVDHTEKSYAILQINRDTMTKVNLILSDGSGEARALEQICCAHWYGGNKEMSCKNTVAAVSELLGGLPIDGYYAIPMQEIMRLNATVGGVTLTVQGDFTREDPSLVAGETITLTDEQAEHYVRGRMSVDDGGNQSRMSRQKQFMTAYMQQAREKTSQDQKFLLDVFDSFSDVATTSLNGKHISKLGNDLYQYKNIGIFEFEGKESLGQALGDGLDHAEFYVDEASMTSIMEQLYHLQPVIDDEDEYDEEDEEDDE